MEFGYLIGWVGVSLGLIVPIPQLIKIRRTEKVEGIALKTYIFLCCALACYLAHAIWISAEVFIVAQSINLVTNGMVLRLLFKHRLTIK